ncbi:MAG: COX15/CtaA family protein [Burkholderiales bacterium]
MRDPIWQFSLQSLHALAWGGLLLLALYFCVRLLSLRTLVIATAVCTFCLIVLGAYVRLTDAGLGCPDWPGCYGQLTPLHAEQHIRSAEAAAPAGPVSVPKAWREMLHRYAASLVGAMILAILLQGLINRRRQRIDPDDPAQAIALPLLLVGVVILQGLIGKWTVTLLLKPAIVTLHLLGGMLILALLTWLVAGHLALKGAQRPVAARSLRPWAALGLLILWGQIALGGWVSTNYAGLVCVDFPTCNGRLLPAMDFEHGFHVLRELGMTAAGEPLSSEALNAIHWAHRAGALATFLYLALLGGWTARTIGLRSHGIALLAMLVVQDALGIGNVLSMLPLPVAVAHNAGAALLLALLVMLNFALYSEPAR